MSSEYAAPAKLGVDIGSVTHRGAQSYVIICRSDSVNDCVQPEVSPIGSLNRRIRLIVFCKRGPDTGKHLQNTCEIQRYLMRFARRLTCKEQYVVLALQNNV